MDMLYLRKILIIFLFVIFLSLIFVDFSFAQRELEVPIPGLTTTTLPALPEYIDAIYRFAVISFGLICFGALVYGGFRYLTSAGSPAAMADAKDQIFSAILGLIILFSSWLILNTINPELLILCKPGEVCPSKEILTTEPQPHELVMRLYKDADYQGDSCGIGKSDKWIEDLCGADWNDTISSIKIEDPNYVAVIHEDKDFTGKAQLIEINVPKLDAHMNDQTSSITVIRKVGSSGKATLYGDADYKFERNGEWHPFAKDFYTAYPNFRALEYEYEGETVNFDNQASSITVERGVIAIIYEHPDYKGGARIITKDDPNLCYLGAGWCDILHPRCNYWPCYPGTSPFCSINDCISSIQIVNGYIVTTLPSRCAGFPDTTCAAEGCEWCPKCSANYEENSWGFDACLEPGTCTRTCSANCDGEICPRCSGFDEADPSQADKCVLTGTCAHPITCSAACNGEMCLKCGGAGGLFENPFDADTCVATGTCTHPDCSAACGGEWCPKCSPTGFFENPWGADTCVQAGQCTYPNCTAACECITTLYEDANYGGASLQVTGDIADLDTVGFNNKASSIKVPPGVTVVIYTGKNFDTSRPYRTITADDPNFDTCDAEDFCSPNCADAPELSHCACYLLTNECWNDKVSSIDVQ